MPSMSTAPVLSKFPSFPRLPAEIRLQIWETHLAAPASEPILATPYHYNCSQPILCISPLLAVSHEARCAGQVQDSRPQPQLQPQYQTQCPTLSVSDTCVKNKEQQKGVVASSVWNPETRRFSWWGKDGPGVDYHARIAARRLFLRSPNLVETLVLAEVKRFEVRYVY